jgi:hypothetical protein
MKKILFYFVVLLFLISPIYAQWVQVPSGTNENLNDIQFVDVNTGYAVGNGGVVLVTTNSGNNWSSINTGLTQNNLSIYFLTSNTGYISSYNNILFTSNGGNNWSTMYTVSTSIFSSLYFINPSTGFATSNSNYYGLFITTNGGLNWSNYPYAFCKSVKFLNSTFGYCTSLYWDTYGWYDRVLITSSSGSNWDFHDVYPSTYQIGHLNSVDFISTTVAQ